MLCNKQINFENYAERVLDWLSDRPTHLKEESYAKLSPDAQIWQHFCHGFSLAVNPFFDTNYAISYPWTNQITGEQDTAYCIPGEVTIQNEQIRGLFVICVGADGLIYHRYFHRSITQQAFLDIITNINTAYLKFDFPSLQQSQLLISPPKIFKSIHLEAQQLTDTPILGPFNSIIINDFKFGLKIQLFKI